MHTQLLIDAIVRQTTVLIAQLSTAAGARAALAHVADQIFLDLSREIEAQGVSRKVAADMFGLALRTYQQKVQRLSESHTERDRTLWEAVLLHVEEAGEVTRGELADHFVREDPNTLGAVVSDLLQSGLLRKQTSRRGSVLSSTTPEQRRASSLDALREALPSLVWVAVYRGASSDAELIAQLGIDAGRLNEALDELLRDGRLRRSEAGKLRTTGVTIPLGAEQGWEAAVYDHYQALVTALSRKLNEGQLRAEADDVVGGATLTFEISAEHPLRDEVRSLLRRTRAEVNELFERVRDHNRLAPIDEAQREQVSFYFGQSTSEPSSDEGSR